MDGELIFQVQGHSPTPFLVRFSRVGEQLSATCTCNAGHLGKLCKHRLGLMRGVTVGLVSGNADQLPQIHALFRDSKGAPAMQGLLEAEAALLQAEAVFTEKKMAFQSAIQTSAVMGETPTT